MPPENLRFSKGTEVLIPRVGEDPMDYNHCTWLSMPDVAIGEMISVFNTDNNPLFTATMFNATLQNEFAMRVEGGSVTNLYFEKLKNIEVSFPSIQEQEKIAAYFENLDHLITLHQRKCYRFIDIALDAWEQRKLGEMIKEYKETVDSDCILPVLTSSKTEGVILQEEHFGRKQQHDITGYNILPRNYCTYRNRSDGVDFTFNINKCCDKGIISKFYPVFSGNNSDVFFISLLLNNSDEIVQEIAYTCTGTGQKVLSFLDLQKMKIKVPNFEEQKKIAAYFDHLDHLITLHQRKCEETKSLKKYMLQKMFPENGKCVPEIRFSGFSDAWEQRKLEEYLGVSKEKNRDESFGKDDVLSVSGEYGIVNQIEFQGRSFAGASVANYGVVEGGDVVYTKSPLKSNPYGIIKTNKGKTGIVSTLYAVYKPKNNVGAEFVQIYFELDSRMNSYMHPLVNKGAKNDMKVSDENALKGSVIFPKIDEQKAISKYFAQLDHLITLHQHKCDELQKLKKFMLQNMFV